MSQGTKTSPPIKSLESEGNMWGMILHLSVFAGYVVPLAGLVAPIVIWQMKKDQFPIVDEHGKNQFNWMISMLIYSTVTGLFSLVVWALMVVFIGFLLLPLLVIAGFLIGIAAIVLPIIAALKANNGEVWPYPLTIRFLS